MMTKTLITLIQNSVSLEEIDKQRLIAKVSNMTPEELAHLEQTLKKEVERKQKIDAEYHTETQKLHQEYDQVIDDFNAHTVKTARHFAEEKDRAADLRKATDTLGSL